MLVQAPVPLEHGPGLRQVKLCCVVSSGDAAVLLSFGAPWESTRRPTIRLRYYIDSHFDGPLGWICLHSRGISLGKNTSSNAHKTHKTRNATAALAVERSSFLVLWDLPPMLP